MNKKKNEEHKASPNAAINILVLRLIKNFILLSKIYPAQKNEVFHVRFFK